MTVLVPDWKIAVGKDQAGSLVRWTSIIDSNSVPLVDPGAPPTWTNYKRAQEQLKEDSTLQWIGYPSTMWVIPYMTDAQYELLVSDYLGKAVTIRDAITANTFANFNAVFNMEGRDELSDRWLQFNDSPYGSPGFSGYWGWSGVIITYTRMEAL